MRRHFGWMFFICALSLIHIFIKYKAFVQNTTASSFFHRFVSIASAEKPCYGSTDAVNNDCNLINFGPPSLINTPTISNELTLSEQSSIIYRLYLDYRTTEPSVRILMFRKCNKASMFSMQITLHLFNKTDIVLSNVSAKSECWNRNRWAPHCHWIMHRASSTISNSINALDIAGVTLTRPDNVSLNLPASKIISIQSMEKFKIQLAVCVSPIYMAADWLQLVQFIEVWRSQGAEKIIIFYHAVSATVLRFLRAYESENIVELVAWSSLPVNEYTNFDPNSDLYRIGHDLAENACMYHTANIAKFVAKVDLDEFLIPHSGVLIDILEDALQQSPNVGVFYFSSPRPLLFSKQPAQKLASGLIFPKNIDFSYLKSSYFEDEEVFQTRPSSKIRKTIILPQRINSVQIHAASPLRGYTNKNLRDRVYYLHQRYDYGKKQREITEGVKIFTKKTISMMQTSYDNMITKYFKADFTASPDTEILPLVGQCMIKYGNARGCRAPMHVCFQSVKNLTDWKFVTENSFIVL